MKTTRLTLLVALGLMTGCSTVRQAREAQKESGASLPSGERTVTQQEFAVPEGGVLSLTTAQECSLKWHPAMVMATQNVIAARINLSKAGSNRRPTLSGAVGYDGNKRGNSS